MQTVRSSFRLLALISITALLWNAASGCRSIRLRKMSALEQAEALKNGVLLVRLQSAEKRIEALRDRGYEARATEAEAEQQLENERIVQAFAREWEYCPVFFFFARHSSLISEGKLDGLLMDTAFEPVSVDSLPASSVFIAEFGALQSASGNAGLEALLIMGSTFRQLDGPFPSNVLSNNLGQDEKEQNAVALLNAKLQQFLAEGRLWKKKQELRGARRNL